VKRGGHNYAQDIRLIVQQVMIVPKVFTALASGDRSGYACIHIGNSGKLHIRKLGVEPGVVFAHSPDSDDTSS